MYDISDKLMTLKKYYPLNSSNILYIKYSIKTSTVSSADVNFLFFLQNFIYQKTFNRKNISSVLYPSHLILIF